MHDVRAVLWLLLACLLFTQVFLTNFTSSSNYEKYQYLIIWIDLQLKAKQSTANQSVWYLCDKVYVKSCIPRDDLDL